MLNNVKTDPVINKANHASENWRTSGQRLLPLQQTPAPDGYNIYPTHALGTGKISEGYETLADWIFRHGQVQIDGYTGILWDTIQDSLNEIFDQQSLKVKWHITEYALKDEETIEQNEYKGNDNL